MQSQNQEYEKNTLWPILVETAQALVMYKPHKRYVSTMVLNETPNITPKELSLRLGMPIGEAMVILHELRTETGKSALPQ